MNMHRSTVSHHALFIDSEVSSRISLEATQRSDRRVWQQVMQLSLARPTGTLNCLVAVWQVM